MPQCTSDCGCDGGEYCLYFFRVITYIPSVMTPLIILITCLLDLSRPQETARCLSVLPIVDVTEAAAWVVNPEVFQHLGANPGGMMRVSTYPYPLDVITPLCASGETTTASRNNKLPITKKIQTSSEQMDLQGTLLPQRDQPALTIENN